MGEGPIVTIRLSQFNCNCNYLLELAIYKSLVTIYFKGNVSKPDYLLRNKHKICAEVA